MWLRLKYGVIQRYRWLQQYRHCTVIGILKYVPIVERWIDYLSYIDMNRRLKLFVYIDEIWTDRSLPTSA